MGGACAPIRSPPGISGTGHPARVYPEAWQAGKAPVGRPLRQRPGAPAQHRPGVVGHLRGGFFALLIWRTAWTGSPPCLGNPQRGNRRWQGELGAGGGPEEFLRESQSRMGALLRGAPRRRSAHDQPDPALVEGRHPGRRRDLSKRGGNPTRRFDQRHAEQRVPALCTRPMVRARGQTPLAAQSHVVAGTDATNPALVGPGTGQHSQRRTEGPLRLLRHCRKLSFPAKGPSGGRTLLAQNAVQPELGRAHHVGHVPPDQTAATDLATKAVHSLSGVTSSRSAVNHLLKSVVREIRTLRSVGTGGGRPPPVTRWVPSNGHPYRNHDKSVNHYRMTDTREPDPKGKLHRPPLMRVMRLVRKHLASVEP